MYGISEGLKAMTTYKKEILLFIYKGQSKRNWSMFLKCKTK